LYASDGKLNTAQLAGIVFSDANKLAQLNQLVHPAVFEDFNKWCADHAQAPFIVKEAALVYETIIYQQLDKIIVVTAPENTRIARVMKRDKVSKEQVLQRISNQLPEAEKVKRADYLIYNDESKSVIEQTLAIQKQLLAL
jgi:dephospho-CoA kinase